MKKPPEIHWSVKEITDFIALANILRIIAEISAESRK